MKRYEEPKVEVIELLEEDIIATSGEIKKNPTETAEMDIPLTVAKAPSVLGQ